MPSDRETGAFGHDEAPKMTRWQRLKYTIVQPDDDPSEKESVPDRSPEEVEEAIRRSDDRERVIGLVAAPVAALVGLFISAASVDYARSHDQSTTVYSELTYVLLGLALLILVASLLRKRVFQGVTLALFGVAVFQLHYSYVGFAAPFVLAGAWYLVKAYRLQSELKRVKPAGGGPPTRKGGAQPGTPRPRRNKRYTPPT